MTTDDLVPLGDGPAATVFAGVDEHTGAGYALKVFPGPLDRRTRAAADAELAQLSKLPRHAAVLVADRPETLPDGRFALRMELCPQSLADLVESFGRLSVPDALVLGTVIAAAVATAHREGQVHGAITPGNVLFRASGAPVLSDFGRTLRDAFPGDRLRLLEFTAPETVRDGSADERSDLYGLGATLYFALSGELPHRGPTGEAQGERLLRVLGTAVPPLQRDDAPPALVELVAQLLAKDPQARPADAATVADRLDTLRRQVPPNPAPATPAAQPPAPGQTAKPPPATPSAMDEPADPGAAPAEAEAPSAAMFDDFADPAPPATGEESTATEPAAAAAPATPGRPILVFGPDRPGRRTRRLVLLCAAGGLMVLAAAALLLNRPSEMPVPMPPEQSASGGPPGGSADAPRIELADPADRGNVVELSWHSTGPLDFAVVVAAEGEPTKVLVVQRVTTYRLTVDPVRKYCFQVQGTDGVSVVLSEAKPIRGATCVG